MKWFDDIADTVDVAEVALYGVTTAVLLTVVIYFFADWFS